MYPPQKPDTKCNKRYTKSIFGITTAIQGNLLCKNK